MAAWTQKLIDTFPDSSFLWIEPGGEKDSEGKTTPRSLRHLPYKDANGAVDLPHVRDALSRLNQTDGIPASEKDAIRVKLEKVLQAHGGGSDNDDDDKNGNKLHALPDEMIAPITALIRLDANGDLPQRFPVLTTGHWPNSIKGDFKVTLEVLKGIKQKFDAGIGFPTRDASTGLCVNFEHNIGGAAGAWAKGLELDADEEKDTGTLYATNLEYSDEGEKALRSGRYKGISAEGSLAYVNGKMREIPNHLNLGEKLTAVMTGLAFTNMPFMSMMAPVRLSAFPESDDGSLMVSIKNKETSMTLDEARVQDKDKLTAEGWNLIIDHKDQLSTGELGKFGLTAAADTLTAEDRELLDAVKAGSKKVVDASATLDTLSAEDRDMLSAIRSGQKKVVEGNVLDKLAKLDALEETAEEYRKDKAERFVDEQLTRGALKPDQKQNTVAMLLSLDGDARKQFEDHLAALPSNKLLLEEIGHNQEVMLSIADELKQKTLEAQKAAKERGESLSYAQAQDRLMRDDPQFKQRYEAESKSK